MLTLDNDLSIAIAALARRTPIRTVRTAASPVPV